jgi:hypothetical protein
METTAAGIGEIKYFDGLKFNDTVATMSFAGMKDINENIPITGEQTVLEGVWKNTNRNQATYTFRGDTFRMETPGGKTGNGGTFTFTDSLLTLSISYLITNNTTTDAMAQIVEMRYSFEGGNLVMWNEKLPNQKWIYKKQ